MKFTSYPERFTRNDLHIDPPEEGERKIRALVEAMTMEEKFSLLGGSKEPEDKGKIGNAGYQWGVPRLGIPEAVMYDGPAGITGVVETTGLPQPSLLGCTWDDEMAYEFGAVAASEAAACSGNYLLAPQVDVIRTPHFVRNRDMKSEDSYLAGRLGAAETRGCQDQGVVATIKHFAVANTFGPSFFEHPDLQVDEQTLHEQYCRSFEMSIREGGAGSVMNSYNHVNGSWMSAGRPLLKGILRDQWGFKGSVMSDWGSVHEFTLNKGMDMEMPYPAYNNANRILKRIRSGEMTFEDVDEAVAHVLYAMSTVGLLGLVKLDEEGKVMPDPYHTAPIQMEWLYEEKKAEGLFDENAKKAEKIVEEGAVLLKNDGVLPLSREALAGKVALIGLGSRYPVTGDQQERSFGTIRRMQSGSEALEKETGLRFKDYPGIDYVGEPIPAEVLFRDAAASEPGLTRTYGILEEDRDPLAAAEGPGGAGQAFNGFAFVDEDGVPLETGMTSYNADSARRQAEHQPGEFCCVDSMINFTTGTDGNGGVNKTYRNGADGTAFTNEETYTWKGFLKAPETGDYSLLLECVGGMASFFIRTESGWQEAGRSAMREWAQWPWESLICTREGMGITGKSFSLKEGEIYEILVHARQCVKDKDLQIRLAWQTPSFAKKNYEEAVAAAREADTIIYYACEKVMGSPYGRVAEKSPLEMSGDQADLFRDVLAAKKSDSKLIVIIQTSNARAISEWEPDANAILTAYHPGQEGAGVIAGILAGRINPSGKLSQTWPKRTQDTPITDTPEHFEERGVGTGSYGTGSGVKIRLGEGIFNGYRYYDKAGVEPMYPFGHGLSYTSYEYSGLEIAETKCGTAEAPCPDEDFASTFRVSFDVTNTGDRAGDEIVQLYLGAAEVPAYMQIAEKQLVGYARLKNIAPGETRRAEITIDPRMLCSWDVAGSLKERSDGTKDKWTKVRGERELMVGASSRDIRLRGSIHVKSS
ncbi:MAG: glycoside hydrolase family 3 C-terminal domain-containing protein [Lachnospiraceae bacterium]|nr:glycoside hydrolase family 3 C-terminal domain-containing protein [Lachnospiraceae bacterium]